MARRTRIVHLGGAFLEMRVPSHLTKEEIADLLRERFVKPNEADKRLQIVRVYVGGVEPEDLRFEGEDER